METSAPGPVFDRKMILTVARKLRAGHAKETGREVVLWAEVPADERKLWIKLATRAARIILDEPSGRMAASTSEPQEP